MSENILDMDIIHFTLCNLCREVNEILSVVLSKPKVTNANPFYRGGYTRSAVVPSSYNDNFNGALRFYEWSNLSNRPRIFQSMSRFLAFLGSSGIPISDVEKKMLLDMRNPFVTCVKGKRDLLIRDNITNLRIALESMEKKVNGYGGVVLPGIKDLVCKGDEEKPLEVKSYDDGGKQYPALCPSVPNKPYNGEYVGQWFG